MNFSHSASFTKVNPNWFLLTGIILISLTHLTYGIGFLAWFSSVPFLMYLKFTKGFRSRLLLFTALLIAWSLVVVKIVTPPIPFIMVFLFSVPISLFHLPAYLLWSGYKENPKSIILFPALFVIMEWIQYTFTPFASWGVAAYTQMNSMFMMQSVSLLGMAGLSFIIYWSNSAIAWVLASENRLEFKSLFNHKLLLPLLFFGLLAFYGEVRSSFSRAEGSKTIKVAAVGTDSEIGGLPLPAKHSNENVISGIFNRTRIAAKAGARLIVWNEGSFYVLPDDEKDKITEISKIAIETGSTIIASYILPVSQTPLKYHNKLLYIDGSGKVLFTYLKHEPVPGEPAEKGDEPLKVMQLDGSSIGGAICYDYDFPYLAEGYGKLKADIVALPSSDWRGIDPLHTRMAAFRAVEQGHSIIRSTRFGLSATINPYGEMTSQMSSFDGNDKIMIGTIPANGVRTVYSVIGDLLIYVCIGFVLYFLITNSIKKK